MYGKEKLRYAIDESSLRSIVSKTFYTVSTVYKVFDCIAHTALKRARRCLETGARSNVKGACASSKATERQIF